MGSSRKKNLMLGQTHMIKGEERVRFLSGDFWPQSVDLNLSKAEAILSYW
jgi:hypothetical protein